VSSCVECTWISDLTREFRQLVPGLPSHQLASRSCLSSPTPQTASTAPPTPTPQVLLTSACFMVFTLPAGSSLGSRFLQLATGAPPLLTSVRSVDEAVVISAALALSSSAFVLQLLAERGETPTRFGGATLGVLLMQVGGVSLGGWGLGGLGGDGRDLERGGGCGKGWAQSEAMPPPSCCKIGHTGPTQQDIAVVPFLVLLPLIESNGGMDSATPTSLLQSLAPTALNSAVGLGLLLLSGRVVLRRVFQVRLD
jgi:hypothetical protein